MARFPEEPSCLLQLLVGLQALKHDPGPAFLQQHLRLTMGMLERFSAEERLLLKQTYAWYLDQQQKGRLQFA